MPKTHKDNTLPRWVEGEIKIAGSLDLHTIKLLESVEQTGSIRQAAKDIGLSYKCAWETLEIANRTFAKALFKTSIGGTTGGGARLTNGGKVLLQLFRQLDEQHQSFLQQLNQGLSDDILAQQLLEPLTIKNTFTNQLSGTVINIQPGSASDEVVVQLNGGERIVADLNDGEFEQLELNVGKPVLLLISSLDIGIVIDSDDCRFFSRNSLHCSVIAMKKVSADYCVVLRMIGGDEISIVIPRPSAESIGLRTGMPTRAVFNGSAVVIASRI
jgi:molybdate transport system regulatory protein